MKLILYMVMSADGVVAKDANNFKRRTDKAN